MNHLSPLLKARYGESSAPDVTGTGGTSPTLETLLQHKSVRHYLPKPLEPGTLELLVAAGQSAATSSNLQTWSVVAVSEPEHKEKVATLCGDQDFIRHAPLFLVFCADLSRLTHVSAQQKSPGEGLEYVEMFLMASLDAALAGQNVAVAAEALDLGICYVGAARNHPRELAELLKLPDRVIALFGMTVGWPDPQRPASVKPRLPQGEVLHREMWSDAAQIEHFAEYDKTLAQFDQGQHRGDVGTWTNRSARRVATAKSLTGRHVLREILEERGFNLR